MFYVKLCFVISLGSVDGITYVLTQWLDKIEQKRRELSAAFQRLQFFAQNVKARDQLEVGLVGRIEHFVQTALACHLDLKLKSNANVRKYNINLNLIILNINLLVLKKAKESRSNKTICELCKVKGLLLRYECVLFNKTIDASDEDSKGTWNPTYQEDILKGELCFVCLSNCQLINYGTFSMFNEFEEHIPQVHRTHKEW